MSQNRVQIKKRKAAGSPNQAKAEGGFARWAADRLFTLALVGAMTLGICLLAYPSVADYWNSFHQSKAIMSYAESIADMNTDEYEKLLEEARVYNSELADKGINWILTDEERRAYNEQLHLDENGVMGYIKIQKIDVMLPIYHGTEDSVLETSIGHLEQSSLPVGGESTHCMLSGHRGLPSARLFTDLDKLREGDTFTMTILNETLTYEIDHIWIVDPDDLAHLQIEQGKDLCTLITCTPYGVNTHRLLVQGHRIENVDGTAMIVADAIQIRPVYIAPFVAIPILILLLIYVLISTSARYTLKKDLKAEYLNEGGIDEAALYFDDNIENMESVQEFLTGEDKSSASKRRRKLQD